MLHEPTEPTIRIRPLLEQVRRAAHEADQQERARRPARLHPSACGGCPTLRESKKSKAKSRKEPHP